MFKSHAGLADFSLQVQSDIACGTEVKRVDYNKLYSSMYLLL